MSDFQDRLRDLEKDSDRIESDEAELRASAVRNRAEQVKAANALAELVDACIAEAKTAVPSLTTEHPDVGPSNDEWTVFWKGGDRRLKIQLLQDTGVVWWTWYGHGRASSIAKRSARDVDRAFVENLIAALADPSSWQRGSFPPAPLW